MQFNAFDPFHNDFFSEFKSMMMPRNFDRLEDEMDVFSDFHNNLFDMPRGAMQNQPKGC